MLIWIYTPYVVLMQIMIKNMQELTWVVYKDPVQVVSG